jgi:UDP-N-acetylmuramate dehydrogenase
MRIQENVSLAPFTTFRIGGAARFFVQARSVADIEAAVAFAQQGTGRGGQGMFILGGGSNVLVSDLGWDGLVIKMELKGITEENQGEFVRVIAGAGEDWDSFVKYTVEEWALYGLENLSLIPGTVGASPVQNIGAYGVEAKDTIEWVEVYDPATKKVETLSNADCRFGYRDSIFKHERKHNVILRVAFALRKNGKPLIGYKDLERFFANRAGGSGAPSLRDVRDAIRAIRAKKFPDLSKTGTAGSFFKNVVISRTEHEELLKQYPMMPCFPIGAPDGAGDIAQDTREKPMVKVPTAWIMDNVCGFKGVRRGDVGVFENQAIVLVNFGKGTAQEVRTLADEMMASVKRKTGITISPEVEFIG